MSADATNKDTRSRTKLQHALAGYEGPTRPRALRLAALAVLAAAVPVAAYLVSGLVTMLIFPLFSEY